MRQAYRLAVCLFVFTLAATNHGIKAEGVLPFSFQRQSDNPFDFRFDPTSFHLSGRRSIGFTANYNDEIELSLYEAVTNRLGLPYRSRGTDDRGYDCSGLVWRVFHDAGIEFERGPARALWQTLPEATDRERSQFGTLVFFKGLTHVGIVRDRHSFFHASSSQGVVRSYFSDYWGKRIIGYRRAFAPLEKANKWRATLKR